MMRWVWRDQPVSTDPDDSVERSFREPASNSEESKTLQQLDEESYPVVKNAVSSSKSPR